MEHRVAFFLSKYLRILPVIGLVPLTLMAIFVTVPIFRFLAVFLLACSVVSLAFANLYLTRQTTQLGYYIDSQEQIIAQRQRYLIAAELHETVTQLLFATTLITNAMLTNEDAYPCQIASGLKDLHQLTSTTYIAIRHVLLEVRSTRINEVPLDRLITELVQIKRLGIETDIQCMAIGTGYYPLDVHQSLYRIVDLALSNSVLHAQASYILVRLFLSQDEAIISVEDDGCGFNPTESKPGHFGLDDIETCARDIGAMLDWHTLPGPNPKKITCIWRRASWS